MRRKINNMRRKINNMRRKINNINSELLLHYLFHLLYLSHSNDYYFNYSEKKNK